MSDAFKDDWFDDLYDERCVICRVGVLAPALAERVHNAVSSSPIVSMTADEFLHWLDAL